MLHVNIIALTQLTKLMLAGMLKHKEGKILNVASTAAFRPGPLMAVYYATKAYVLSFSEAIAEEVRGTGVTVTTLCPGATATNFAKTAGLSGSRFLGFRKPASVKAVALFGYKHMMRGNGLVIYGILNRILLLLFKFVPREAVSWASRKIKENRHR
jgi:short-subunit dehydrogenase